MDKTTDWENASLASTMTDIEQVTKLATQLGRTERENEDLKKSLEARKAFENFQKFFHKFIQCKNDQNLMIK